MSKCDLKIVLNNPDRTCAAGERVEGAVEVDVRSDCECRHLTLHHEWRTSGKGGADSGGEQDLSLFSGTWTAGEHASYPFEFIAPRRPLTYHGKILSVDWYLRAHAELAHGTEVKSEEKFTLIPGKAHEEEYHASAPKPGDRLTVMKVEKMGAGFDLWGGILFFFLGLAACGWLVWKIFGKAMRPYYRGAWGDYVFLGFGAVFSGYAAYAGARMLLETLGTNLTSRKLGRIEVELHPRLIRPGETLTCKIHFRPLSSAELSLAAVRLRGQEYAYKKRTSYQHDVFDGRSVFASRRTLAAGEDVLLEGAIELPPDAPYTLKLGLNEVHWWAVVELKVGHWPNWSHDFDIHVRP